MDIHEVEEVIRKRIPEFYPNDPEGLKKILDDVMLTNGGKICIRVAVTKTLSLLDLMNVLDHRIVSLSDLRRNDVVAVWSGQELVYHFRNVEYDDLRSDKGLVLDSEVGEVD